MPTITNVSTASSPCGKAHHYELGQCLACRISELEKALRMADIHFGYPERGSAIGECKCSYCEYARVRDSLMER